METLKNKEVLFTYSKDVDSKHKLNTCNKTVDSLLLHKIEQGVTSEVLTELLRSYPIYQYYTQITIHGLFPNLGNNYLHGYKHLFQNKNKSIGVKYGAIDEGKRVAIAKHIKHAGIGYHKNSSEHTFYKTLDYTPENYARLIQLKNKIDTSLFEGGVSIVRGNVWGRMVIQLTIVINTIPEANVPVFCENIITTNEVERTIEAKEQERKAWREKYDAEIMVTKERRATLMQQAATELSKAGYREVTTAEAGNYIIPFMDYNDNLKYKAAIVYMDSPRARIADIATKEFNALSEATAYSFEGSKIYWHGNKLRKPQKMWVK